MPPPPHPGKHKPTEADVDISVVMIGFVVFSMTMMHVLRSRSPTLRTGGWLAVSKAMCCYMGTLINMSMYGNLSFWLKTKTPIEQPDVRTALLDVTLFFFWWIVKMGAAAHTIGIVTFSKETTKLNDEECAWKMESVGTVLGFVSGSSAMQAFASMQQLGRGTRFENLVVIGVMPFCWGFMYVVFRFGTRLRDWLANQDGTISDSEAAWGAYMDFAENKVVGLSMSHLMVQTLRIYLTGQYPGVMGQQLPGYDGPLVLDACLLSVAGCIFMVLSVLTTKFVPQSLGKGKMWLKMSSSLAVAWCALYSINWVAADYFGQKAFTHLCQTCAATCIGMGMMIAITHCSEQQQVDDEDECETELDLLRWEVQTLKNLDIQGAEDLVCTKKARIHHLQRTKSLFRSNAHTFRSARFSELSSLSTVEALTPRDGAAGDDDGRKPLNFDARRSVSSTNPRLEWESPPKTLLAQEFFVPIAVLIGFSWRDAWSGALQTVVTAWNPLPAPIEMLIAATFMLILVYPAWHQYILPMTFIKWERFSKKEKRGITSDSLKPVFTLPRWLKQDLEKKRQDWTHIAPYTLNRAIVSETNHMVEEGLGAVQSFFFTCTQKRKSQVTDKSATHGDGPQHDRQVAFEDQSDKLRPTGRLASSLQHQLDECTAGGQISCPSGTRDSSDDRVAIGTPYLPLPGHGENPRDATML